MEIQNKQDINERQYIIYYEVPITTVSVIYLIDLILNFSLRGVKGVWNDRPILLLEIIISGMFWYTFFDDFVLSTEYSLEKRFA